MNSSLEKEITVSKRELEEALGERALLGEVVLSLCFTSTQITHCSIKFNQCSLILSGG